MYVLKNINYKLVTHPRSNHPQAKWWWLRPPPRAMGVVWPPPKLYLGLGQNGVGGHSMWPKRVAQFYFIFFIKTKPQKF